MSRTPNEEGHDSTPRQNTAPQNSRPTIAPYAILSLGSFASGLVLVALLLWKGDKLTAWGLTGNFYYLILLPLGLTAAAFLFGAMRSYARYQGRQLGGALELGGPIVGFALVVIGGFVLVKNPATVPLTVYVHGEAGRHELVLRNVGYVMVDLGPDRRREPISDKGQAYFPAIPAGFRGQQVAVWLDADGYELVNPGTQPRLDGDSLYLAVRKTAGRISGRVQDEGGRPIAAAVLSVAGISATTDATGHFEVTIPANRLQPELPLQAIAPGFEPSHIHVVPGSNETTVMLKRSP
ncbi:MAG: carboxypeptidase-like regulatory domain-containing protein [Gammaproteobacteria bacterium]